MKRILDLKSEHFLTGIARGSETQNSGLFHKAKGINPVQNIFTESETLGILQTSPSPTNLTASVIVDTPWSYVVNGSARYMYITGDDGHFYTIDVSGDNAPVDLRTGGAVISSPAAGVGIFQPNGGDKYLLYAQLTQVGRLNLTTAANFPTTYSAGEWTDNQYTGLQSTKYHSMHPMFDELYYLNKDRIGKFSDNGAGGITHSANVLDFPSDFLATAINDDGVYLVAGLSKNTTTDANSRGEAKVIFWARSSSSWDREWSIPDAAIRSIQRVGNVMYAITARGIFAFTFSTPPELVLPLLTTDKVPLGSYPAQDAADVLGTALLWGGDTIISSLGKFTPGSPNAYLEPFASMTGQTTMIAADARTARIWAGTSQDKLYRFQYDGSNATSLTAETIYVDLERWYQIGRITVHLQYPLASGDSLNIDVQKDPNTTATDWGTVAFSTHGAARSVELFKSFEANKLKLILNFNGGAVRIREIEVFGDALETPTHTRT